VNNTKLGIKNTKFISRRRLAMIVEFADEHRLKVEKDDCGDAIIPGKYGYVYEYGTRKLGVCMMSESGTAYRWNRTRAAFIAAGMEITQSGDYEGCATFDPGNSTQVKEAINHAKVKTKRQVDPKYREAMLANLARARKVRQSTSSV
jgi:hypothetical protein